MKNKDNSDPRNMFDHLPPNVFHKLKKLGQELSDILVHYYDPHTEIVIKEGHLMIKRDVVNTYLKKGDD